MLHPVQFEVDVVVRRDSLASAGVNTPLIAKMTDNLEIIGRTMGAGKT